AQRMAEAESRARAQAIAEAERARTAARAAQERARRLAAKRETPPAPMRAPDQIATAAPPTNILPTVSLTPPPPEPETMLDKVKGSFKSSIGKMHDFVSAAIRLDNPFKAVSPRGAPSTEQRARFSGLDL
ncbi:MAG: hypothetical protein HXY30_00195, partial [Pseudorhodoplanes sp.]|nr:hypothetical protein [Pseudorhodoplanes sp.]